MGKDPCAVVVGSVVPPDAGLRTLESHGTGAAVIPPATAVAGGPSIAEIAGLFASAWLTQYY